MITQNDDISVVIFDDEEERRTQADLLREETGYRVEFVNLAGKEAIDEVKRAAIDFQQPSLVLVDHFLRKAQELDKGTSIVPLLRERWPGVPVMALTAAYQECVSDLDSEVYDDVVPLEWFGDFVKYVPTVIADYKALKEPIADIDAFFSLLNVPDSEKDALQSSLPSSLKRSFGNASFPHHAFRWFRGTFHRKPGFLLDEHWTALAIGVSSTAFADYVAGVSKAQYDGIFADPTELRWWKSRLYSCLLPESQQRFTIRLCEAAKHKLKIAEDDESKCYRCDEKWPEVMGYVDESALDEKDAKPMHLRCSRAHPLSSPEPFYEERRIMLDEE